MAFDSSGDCVASPSTTVPLVGVGPMWALAPAATMQSRSDEEGSA